MTPKPACKNSIDRPSSNLRRQLLTWPCWAALGTLSACGGGGTEVPAVADAPDSVALPVAPELPAPTDPPLVNSEPDWSQGYRAGVSGRSLHVAPGGSNDSAGTQGSPFATLQHALSLAMPGDTVILADGLYVEDAFMTHGGSAEAYITLRAQNPLAARLLAPEGSYSALTLSGLGWVRVEGLDCQGALGHGIDVSNCHHIQLVGNRCHDSGGSGISLDTGDYFLVAANEVFGNARTNRFQTSGISIYQARAYDSAPGFHIRVLRNLVHSNIESATGLAETSEGNGIILDDFRNEQVTTGSAAAGAYAQQTLVENNIAFNNGGGGIVCFHTDHVTVRHNTSADNNTDPLNLGIWRGELSNSHGRNNRWYNNIAVCDSARSPSSNALLEVVTGGFANEGSQWVGNLLFDRAAPARDALLVAGAGNRYDAAQALALNRWRQDPRFAGGAALTAARFALLADSSARGAALLAAAAPRDFEDRPRDGTPDVGALEGF